MLIVTPVAVLAAVYLAEYAEQGRLVSARSASPPTRSPVVPSIVMGLFGFALFVEAMGIGFSMLSAALALSLPDAARSSCGRPRRRSAPCPRYIRWGSYGLGATKWQTVSKVVLPAAAPRIITGIILATGRAVGETAVVIYTMGTTINLPYIAARLGPVR